MAINGEIEGLDALFEKLDGLGGNLIEGAEAGMHEAVKLIQIQAKGYAPKDTEQLINSIKTDVTVGGQEVVGTIKPDVDYAGYVEFGTGPMAEKLDPAFGPRNPYDEVTHRPISWRYFSPKLNRWVITKGQPARPYMYPAFLAKREEAKQTIEDELQKRIDALSKDT